MATRLPSFTSALIGVPLVIPQGWTNIAIIPGVGGTVTVESADGNSIEITSATVLGGGGSNNSFDYIWGEITLTAATANSQIIIDGDVSFQTQLNNLQPLDPDLLAIAALGFTSLAFLKKTGINTWALDTTVYQASANAAVALVNAPTMALVATKQTLSSADAARTFTISYAGDDITIEVILANTGAVYTFPATALCVSEGIASGDNTLTLSGTSGDKYIIAIKKIGSNYYVVAKNFGQ